MDPSGGNSPTHWPPSLGLLPAANGWATYRLLCIPQAMRSMKLTEEGPALPRLLVASPRATRQPPVCPHRVVFSSPLSN